MGQLKAGWQPNIGEYNFATDPGAGVIGVVALNVFIPQFSLIQGFYINTITAPTSGGAATIAFSGVSLGTGAAVTLLAATAIAGFVVGPVSLRGTDLDSTPFKTVGGVYQIQMTIAAANLTGGRLQFFTKYHNAEL